MRNIDKIIRNILNGYRGINLNYDAVIEKLTYELSSAVMEEYSKDLGQTHETTLDIIKGAFKEARNEEEA